MKKTNSEWFLQLTIQFLLLLDLEKAEEEIKQMQMFFLDYKKIPEDCLESNKKRTDEGWF